VLHIDLARIRRNSVATCANCGVNVNFFSQTAGLCPRCHFKRLRLERGEIDPPESDGDAAPPALEPEPDLSTIILSTEAATELQIAERLDIITAEFAVGMGLLTDIFNAWRDVFGGRSKSYQNALKDARKAVLLELRREAHLIGADAVLGVSLDYSEISGGGKSMLFLVASGTAVRLAKAH
jgi:uncharacterized protein YbjQ (UPF0145 family)/DNA-directed RNA polymerase subunit RPC12/RpoP